MNVKYQVRQEREFMTKTQRNRRCSELFSLTLKASTLVLSILGVLTLGIVGPVGASSRKQRDLKKYCIRRRFNNE
jgi:hypothetical protein